MDGIPGGQGSQHPPGMPRPGEPLDATGDVGRRLASAAKPGWGVTWMADRPERPTWHWPGLRGVGFEETVGLPMVAL
jgi:hypothetical protein